MFCRCRSEAVEQPSSLSATSRHFLATTSTATIRIHFVWVLRSRCLGGSAVRASDFRPSCRGFDSRSGRNQGTYVNSAFHPSGIGKSITNLCWLRLRRGAFACVGWQVTLCDPIWQVTACSSVMGSPTKLIEQWYGANLKIVKNSERSKMKKLKNYAAIQLHTAV